MISGTARYRYPNIRILTFYYQGTTF